jgi:adenylate cyclase
MNTSAARATSADVLRRTGRIFSRFGYERAAALVLLLTMVLVRLWDPLPVELLRLKVFDAYQSLKPRQAAARPVTIVDIDEASIAAFGQWPWPRTRVAEIVTRLKALGALAIGFDIVFAEPDRLSPGRIAKDLPDLDEPTRAKLEALPSNDDVLAAALHQARTVLGETAIDTPAPPRDDERRTGFATRGPSALPFVRRYSGLLPNVALLERATSGRGLFTIAAERDGIVRRVPMVLAVGDQLFPSLTLELLRVLTGAGAILVRTDTTGVLGLALPGLQLPTDPAGQIWVHFSAHDPARFISAKDILDGTASPSRVAGKIILIGTSAIGLLDNKTTPLSRSMPGVEIHAQVLESALSNAMLHEPNFALAIEVLTALAAGTAIIIFAPLLGPALLLIFGAAVASALIALSWWNFTNKGVLVDASYPLISSLVVYSALAFMNYFREQLGRRRIRSAFSQYLSPDLVAQLSKSAEALVLGGETRVMSIMFSDVRGFTGISESYKNDPQGLTTLMNRFLTPLTNAIISHKGTIDKYMGDAIMAFWNAPLRDASQEHNACRAALDMLSRLDALNIQREAEEALHQRPCKQLEIGIGINTGECVVGNMGSDLRFDYSVLGDAVNLASRLEGQSKTYGVKIILGDATAGAVMDTFALIEVDLLQVKGKTDPQAVWTLLGTNAVRDDPGFQELASSHAAMLACYRNRDFSTASHLIGRCRLLGQRFGLDTLYDLYQERIAAFIETPPPAGWRGVFVAVSK